MTIIRNVVVDGRTCPVTISDEREALLAAEAAGGAIIGIWRPERPETAGFSSEDSAGSSEPGGKASESGAGAAQPGAALPESCLYLVTKPEEADEWLLERAARRRLDLPWRIARTERLEIREFCAFDPLEEPSPQDGDGVFSQWEKREAYRRNQYRFCECGLWALVRAADGEIVGKAGITGGELGYHIYGPYRQKGYAREACRAIMDYAREEMELTALTLRADPGNAASLALAARLGFRRIGEEQGVLLLRAELAPGQL